MELMTSPENCVDAIIARVGNDLRVGTPLAIGKPNHLLNALYRRALSDPSIRLSIFTALTLELPKGKSDLEQRFLEPMVERVFKNYPDLDYELARVAGELPENVRVMEFYFQAGKFTRNAAAQRDYISTNYTYVARDLLDRGVNVLVQQVAAGTVDGTQMLSMSCNPDVTLDLIAALEGRDDVAFAAQINGELPFMYGDAVVPRDRFHFVIENPELDYTLFGPPKFPISDPDYLIGLYASTLIRDDGELQIGIGALGDAIVYALKLRHEDNGAYRRVLDTVGVLERCGEVISRLGGLDQFEDGLFAASEMLVDGFMHLYRAGIIKRRVYQDLVIQRLLNEEQITEEVTPATLRQLWQRKGVQQRLTAEDVAHLVRLGVFKKGVRHDEGAIVTPDGERIGADLGNDDDFDAISRHCLGDRLAGGQVMQGAFFLGAPDFYQWLRDMPEEERRLINMRSVTAINQLYGHEALDRLHRKNARFVNTGMMVTLLGAVVSDGLEDGTVISGVGGQYNFVAMAHALPDGHSILQIRSTRMQGGELRSNVVWNYGHTTIPRHQRDIIITEYGIADLRGRTDEEVIRELLNVTDSRFQDELMNRAKEAGKLSPDYRIPARHRNNTPDSYRAALTELRSDGLFPPFPFGTDLTDEEITIGAALRRLKGKMESRFQTLEAVADAMTGEGSSDEDVLPYLERMGLADAHSIKEKLYARLLSAELRRDPRMR